MTSALPRFNGPAQARQRLRLIAAIGMLAIAALTTGGLASLTAGRTLLPEEERAPTKTSAPDRRSSSAPDPVTELEARVQRAERELHEAQTALRSARRFGQIDPRLLDELERRLEQAASPPRPIATLPERTLHSAREL